MVAFATVAVHDRVGVTHAEVGAFVLTELRFPAAYVQRPFEPATPYLALVLDGDLVKSFSRRTVELGRSCAVVMPAHARHAAHFGSAGARIVVVRPKSRSAGFERLVELRRPGLAWLGRRLAAELHETDPAAPLAAEGLAFELLAAARREVPAPGTAGRPPSWLRAAEERLRASDGECVRLADLAGAVGVHPAHLARAFRLHYGTSVGEYGRRTRIEGAAAALARGDRPLAAVAAEAGFADQSHFTRLFKRYVGVTPARYRAETRR